MRSISILALTLFTLQSTAGGKVTESLLDNGLKVIIKEDHRAPVVVSQIWYKVGSSYEPAGITGISHVLEHMMFKGSEKFPTGEFSRIVAANGGEENAFTGRDYTAYYQQLAKDRLEISFELEADRMRNISLPADEFIKEIEVVKEERRLRTEDKPLSLTVETFNAIAYQSLPYANPVVGWMNDLENMRVEDLQTWYRRWYAPNNAILIIVGDVNPQEVLALAKKHFEHLKPETISVTKPLLEPPQRGEVRTRVRVPAKESYLILGYKTPVLNTSQEPWEPYALELLAAVLDGGDSARFSRNLVRGAEIAIFADADYSAFSRLPALFTLDGIPAEGHSIEALEKAMKAEVERLKQELVPASELERILAQILAEKVYELDSVFYQAMQIGLLESMGMDWRLLDEYADRLKAVTPEQIKTVANRYLVDNRLTVAVLDPLPMETDNGQ